MIDHATKESPHGSVMFPLGVYHSRPNFDDCVLYSHWHDEVEFFGITRGQASVCIDDCRIEVKAGEAVFIQGGEIHSAFSAGFAECAFFAVVFDLGMLGGRYMQALAHKQCAIPRVITPATAWGRLVLGCLESIVAEFDQALPGHEMAIVANLYALFAGLVRNGQFTPAAPLAAGFQEHRLERFRKALAFMHAHYHHRISIADIATEVNLSPYYFCRFFRQMAGCTPFEYLVKYRINRAERLLVEGGRKIQDISGAVGFDTASHFIKSFRKLNQCTPAVFRKAHALPPPSS